MTGQEFRDYVVRKFKRTDKDTELYEAITDTISDITTRLKADERKEETYVAGISTVGEYQIALPSDFGHIIGKVSIIDTASDDQYNPLNKISKERYDELYSDRSLSAVGNVNTAVPRNFCVYAGQLYIGPVPDLITYRYQINYTTENTAEITSGTDPVPFTSELRNRNMLRSGVLYELHEGLENFQEAAYHKAVYLDGISNMRSMEDRNKAPTSENVIYHGV